MISIDEVFWVFLRSLCCDDLQDQDTDFFFFENTGEKVKIIFSLLYKQIQISKKKILFCKRVSDYSISAMIPYFS